MQRRNVERIDAAGAVRSFRAHFRAIGSTERARGEKAYMKSALRFHGVTVPDLRLACREFSKAHPLLVRDDLRSIVDALYATEYFDLRSVGLLLLEKHRAKLEVRDLPWLIDLVRRSSNWGHVDLLAAKVIGHVVRRAPDADAILQKWAKDESLWVRRTALLAGLDELRAGGGDFDRFERLAAPLVGEKEFFIRKAIGWVLREVSKKRPALSYRFLARHRDEVSGLTLREGAKYLPRAMRGRLGLG